MIVDLKTGERLFERSIGPTVPVPVKGKRKGLTVSRRGVAAEAWRAARIVVSETHAFVVNGGSGQIVVLGRESGEVEQVTEIDAMPIARYEPVIYENHLLLTDLNAAVHCFKGAP